MKKYLDITDFIIYKGFITSNDRDVSGLDIEFQIYGDTIVIIGEESNLNSWTGRYSFTELDATTGQSLVDAHIAAAAIDINI